MAVFASLLQTNHRQINTTNQDWKLQLNQLVLKASLAGDALQARKTKQVKSMVAGQPTEIKQRKLSEKAKNTAPRSELDRDSGTHPQCWKTQPSREGLRFSSLQITGVGELGLVEAISVRPSFFTPKSRTQTTRTEN